MISRNIKISQPLAEAVAVALAAANAVAAAIVIYHNIADIHRNRRCPWKVAISILYPQ